MKPSPAQLAADYFALRAKACEIVAAYQSADADVPQRLLRFAGLQAKRKSPKGPRPIVLPIILRWFAANENEPATYKQIAAGTGLKVVQARTCISRGNTECFERVGDVKEGDKLYAQVRVSEVGLKQLAAEEVNGQSS